MFHVTLVCFPLEFLHPIPTFYQDIDNGVKSINSTFYTCIRSKAWGPLISISSSIHYCVIPFITPVVHEPTGILILKKKKKRSLILSSAPSPIKDLSHLESQIFICLFIQNYFNLILILSSCEDQNLYNLGYNIIAIVSYSIMEIIETKRKSS